jgi:hypothetical protein
LAQAHGSLSPHRWITPSIRPLQQQKPEAQMSIAFIVVAALIVLSTLLVLIDGDPG